MPYAYDPNEDDQNQDNGQDDAGGPQLANSGGTVGGAAAPSANGSGNSGAPTSSGSFQNLNSYLDANSGSDFGGKFVGKINENVDAAQGAQQQAETEFKGSSDAGTTKYNQQTVDSALEDPYAYSQDQGNVDSFQKQLNAKYTGPQSYADNASAYQKAYGATQKAQDTAQAAQTEGGRFSLLNNYFGTPNYNQGQKSLDNLLVQADPTTQEGINQARQNADKSRLSFEAQANPLAEYAAQNNATTQATAKQTRDAGTAAETGLNTEYQKAFTDAQANYQKEQQAIQAALGQGPQAYMDALGKYGLQGGPNDTYAQALAELQGTAQPGSAPAQGGDAHVDRGADPRATLAMNQNYWGVDPSKFISAGAAPNQSSVTSLSQQQKLNALQKLMQDTQTPFDASMAGSYDPSKAVNFNSAAFKDATGTAAANYQQYQSGIMSQIKDILGQTVRGSMGNKNPAQDKGTADKIQALYDQLNGSRKNFGLSQVSNPYAYVPPQSGGTPTRGRL